MFKKLPLLLALVCIAGAVVAQHALPENMFVKKMANGLDVLVIEDNTVPLATIEMAVKGGSYTETPDVNGLSHLYEHMFFKANKDYPDQQSFLQNAQKLGIIFNGSTSNEIVNYYFTLPKINLAAGLGFMNSAIQYPMFDETEMKRENIVVDGEFQRQESNPTYALIDAMDHHLWGASYSRKNVIGDHEVIRSATADKMREIKNKYYWPNNSLLTIAGDVQHDDVFSLVEQYFSSWKASGFDPAEKFPVPEIKPLDKTDYFIVSAPNVQAPILLYEWQGPDTRNNVAGTYIADVFSRIVNQNAGKLQQALVTSGLAQRISIGYLTQKHTGPISLFVVPNPNKIKECAAEITKQLAMFDNDNYFTDEQLTIAKREMEVDVAKEEESTPDFVHVMSFWWCSTSLDYFASYLPNIGNVSRADVQGYVRRYIKNKPYCAGLLVSPEMEKNLNPASFFKAQQ